MNPSQDQVLSWARTTIALLSGAAITHGVGNDQEWALVSGALGLIVPYVWGTIAHTRSNAIATVEANPDVQKIVIATAAAPDMKDIAADPARPKVVDTTTQFQHA